MPNQRIPKYRRHKAKKADRAFVELSGHRIYLGKWDSPESEEKYERVVGEWLSNSRRLPVSKGELTVEELLAAYWKDVQGRFTQSHGIKIKSALRPVRELYASFKAVDFGPRALMAIRQKFVERGLRRSTINEYVGFVRRMFKWAVKQELLPVETWQALESVEGLRRGSPNVQEDGRVPIVPDAHVDAIQPFVSRQVWTVVQLQLLTAARGGELLAMRPIDLNTNGDTWVYTPVSHKTAHHGHERAIYIGPQAQGLIRLFLTGRPVDAFCFSPAEAEAERRAQQHASRATPITQGNRPGTNRTRKPKRTPKDHYTSNTYRRAIQRACAKANVPHWHPHQLRHNAATHIRREHGIESARVLLGHRSAKITETYAELDHKRAVDVIQQVG